MHLIACRERLIVVCLMFFLMDFSQLVKSNCEKKCSGIINDVHFITHIHAMKCTFELQKDGPTVSLGGVHLSMFIQMHSPDNICQES